MTVAELLIGRCHRQMACKSCLLSHTTTRWKVSATAFWACSIQYPLQTGYNSRYTKLTQWVWAGNREVRNTSCLSFYAVANGPWWPAGLRQNLHSEWVNNCCWGWQNRTSQVVYFRNPMKEHLVRHGSKHKIQVHTTKRNKRQQKQKQNRTHFQNKKQRETRERSLTKTKARGKNENRWVQQTHTLTYTDTRLHIEFVHNIWKLKLVIYIYQFKPKI